MVKDESIRGGTLSGVHESKNLPREDWHGFCFGFSTGHMEWELHLLEVDTQSLDFEPIPTREKAQPTLDGAVFRQITFDPEAERLRFAYFYQGHEKEWTLEQPKILNYERIRRDEKELRIDLANGQTALLQLRLVDILEQVGDNNLP